MTAKEIIKKLGLIPHPEGGYYKEVFRSELVVGNACLSKHYQGERNLATSIYFLIENGNFSAFHKIWGDETWHFYCGDPLEVIEINDNGDVYSTLIGPDIHNQQTFQYTVKSNTWFGSRVWGTGSFSLVGCTVYPGFDFRDFELGKRRALLKAFPQHEELIMNLTRI